MPRRPRIARHHLTSPKADAGGHKRTRVWVRPGQGEKALAALHRGTGGAHRRSGFGVWPGARTDVVFVQDCEGPPEMSHYATRRNGLQDVSELDTHPKDISMIFSDAS